MEYTFNVLPQNRNWDALEDLRTRAFRNIENFDFDFSVTLELVATNDIGSYELKSKPNERGRECSIYLQLSPIEFLGATQLINDYNKAVENSRLLHHMEELKRGGRSLFDALMSLAKEKITVTMQINDNAILNDELALLNIGGAMDPNPLSDETLKRKNIEYLMDAYHIDTVWFSDVEEMRAKYRIAFNTIMDKLGDLVTNNYYYLSDEDRNDIQAIVNFIKDQ